MGLSETLDPPFRLIWNTVVRNVEAMPEPSFEFRPEGLEMRSFREIALHMANVCVTLSENIGKAQWERVTAYPPETTRSKAQVLEALREAGERFRGSLARLTDQEAARVVRTPWGAEMSQGDILAGHVPHMYYHNGQLAIYLRLQGVRPLFLAR
jgi:uncharacterized damage-inducible protein DinB